VTVIGEMSGGIMPLQDHFHPPLSLRRAWTSFHSAWATFLASDLNRRLPPGYFAEPNVRFAIEIDVATWDEAGGPPRAEPAPAGAWKPPAPQLTLPLVPVTDVVEVQIVRQEGGPVLAGAVELVSPANKDRPATRDAFVSKCANYLRQGVGLVVVDVVTERRADLHRELLARIAADAAAGPDVELYASAYRPVNRGQQVAVEVWHSALALGGALPTLPLWLRGGVLLPVELEATYERTIQEMRVPANGA
jgi:hypothetical protein